jgi:hypothetical protein
MSRTLENEIETRPEAFFFFLHLFSFKTPPFIITVIIIINHIKVIPII